MLVITSKTGQLGNRLFVFAHLIGFCLENQVSLTNLGFEEYAGLFESTSSDALCRFPAVRAGGSLWSVPRSLTRAMLRGIGILARTRKLNNKLIRYVSSDQTACSLDDLEVRDLLCSARLVFVSGWQFRSELSLHRHAAAIREYFTPLPAHRARIENLMAQVRREMEIVIGVHVRRGDYRTWQGGKYCYGDRDWCDLISRVAALFTGRRVGFLVCSNEPIDLPAFGTLPVCAGTNHLLEDMYAFARCDYLIGPPSTYTMWASYYGAVPLYGVEDIHQAVSLDSFAVA
jgi:hypothetical protein